MKLALMVAEKPSLALSLAKILSDGRCSSRKGFNGACSVHDWTGRFLGESVRFKMTSVCGHVLTTDFVGVYNSWDRVDPAELFTCPTEKKEATPKLQMPKFLQQEGRGCNYLILWLDCDKEGENICFEVLDAVRPTMSAPSRPGERTVFRAKFSAITERDIKAAMESLVDPNENEAKSVDARQDLDLRIGCAFTRFQTKFFQGKYGNLDSSLISYGPCQTPTLGFCVDRHELIQSFKSEAFWFLQLQAEHPSHEFMQLEWERGRIFDREVAQMFLNLTKGERETRVLRIDTKEKTKQRPQALNTVELMKVASSSLGMGPHHAMQIAERLYTQGYISYPRTETTHYPENFDLVGTLRQQSGNSDWGAYVGTLLAQGITKPRKGSDAGDHPPITPMRSASFSALDGGDTWKIYEYIVRHFIASLSPDCRYLQTTVHFQVGSENFTCSGKTPLEDGFTAVMPWLAILPEEKMPTCEPNDVYPISEVKLAEGKTSPPDYLTESELITLMEKHGIGTDASIPVHINNIGQRNYVTVESGRRLVPTTLGVVLVRGYRRIDADLVLPTMRAAVEQQLVLIAQGKADFLDVLKHALDIFRLKFHYFVNNIAGMDDLFEGSFSTLADSGKPLSRCGKCRRYMKFVETKPCRLHCTKCEDTYNLPQCGVIRLYKELKCPLDDFELLQWFGGNRGKSYPFCPYCYNNPPFGDMRKGLGCNSCTHPTCPNGMSVNGVCSCFACENGVIVLDAASGPKWKFGCNQCDIIVRAFEGAHKVTVNRDTCEECQSQSVSVEYKSDKSKLADGVTEATGCLFCEPKFSKLVEKHQAMPDGRNRRNFRGGRGGGGGGRGRGGSRGKPKDKMAQLAAYFV